MARTSIDRRDLKEEQTSIRNDRNPRYRQQCVFAILGFFGPIIVVVLGIGITLITGTGIVFTVFGGIVHLFAIPWLFISYHVIQLPAFFVIAGTSMTISTCATGILLLYPGPWADISKTRAAENQFHQAISQTKAKLHGPLEMPDLSLMGNSFFSNLWRVPLTVGSLMFGLFTGAEALGIQNHTWVGHQLVSLVPQSYTVLLNQGWMSLGTLPTHPFVQMDQYGLSFLWPIGLFVVSTIVLQAVISLVLNLIWAEYHLRQELCTRESLGRTNLEDHRMMNAPLELFTDNLQEARIVSI